MATAKRLNPQASSAKTNRPSAPDNAETLVVKLRATDTTNTDGSPMIQMFKYPMAQRILDTKHPFKGWVLDDAGYEMKSGSIQPVTPTPQQSAVIAEKSAEEEPKG